MAQVIRRVWKSRGPTGHMVNKISYGYSLMVNGQQERRTDARWTKRTRITRSPRGSSA